MKGLRSSLLCTAAMLAPLSLSYPQAPDTLWTRTYGGTRIEQARGIVALSDGGFLIAGYAYEDSVSASDVWWFKIDAGGYMVQEHSSGHAGRDEVATTIEPAPDGGFFLAGYAATEDRHTDVYIIKTDSDGVGSWGFTYGLVGEYSRANAIVAASDGGALAVGSQSFNEAGSDIYIVKTFPLGLLQWDDVTAWSWTDQANGVDQTSDGGYIIAGSTNSYGEHSFGIFLQKIDAAGYSGGMTLYDPAGDQYGNCVKRTSDGGYIIVGSQISSGRLDDDVLVLKTDSLGAFTWVKSYGGTYIDNAKYVQEVDGGYIVTGSGRDTPHLAASNDVYVLRLDLNGDTLWTKYIGYPTTNESSFQIRETADGGYIIAATRTLGSTDADAYVVRLAPDPVTATARRDQILPGEFILHQNFPNPFNPTTLIRYSLPSGGEVRLIVTDLLGRAVAVLVAESKPAGTHQVTFDASGLASGLYLCRLTAGGSGQTRKMVVIR